MRPLNFLPWPIATALTLLRGGARGILGTVTIISLLGIGVGVATLTGVLAVTAGFQEAVRDHILGVYPHILVLKGGAGYTDYRADVKRLLRVPGILEVIPATYDEMIASASKGTAGATVKGVDLSGSFMRRLQGLLKTGSLAAIKYRKGAKRQGVVTGCILADTLGLKPGDLIGLTSPIRGLGNAGPGPLGMMPVETRFVYRGCLNMGFYEYDAHLVLMDLPTAQAFLNRGDRIRWLEIRVKDMFNTDAYVRKVEGALHVYGTPDLVYSVINLKKDMKKDWEGMVKLNGNPKTIGAFVSRVGTVRRDLEFSSLGDVGYSPYRVMDWKQLNANLFAALKLQKSIMVLFFLVIVIVASFNVVGTQMMILREKAREIAILNTIGAGGRGIFKVFFWHGLILGVLGSVLGLVMGIAIVWGIGKYKLALDPSVYMINTLPAHLNIPDALAIAGITLLVLMLTTTLSAYKASRADPVQGLRRVL